MPPSGGYAPIKYKRNLPLRGPSGIVMLSGIGAVCAFGFWRVGQGNLEKKCVVLTCLWLRFRPLALD